MNFKIVLRNIKTQPTKNADEKYSQKSITYFPLLRTITML